MALKRNKAVVLVYAAVIMVALMAFTSLAVDWGRCQTARTELQDATDAAARYAVSGLHDGTAIAKAQQAAVQNTVDGSPLTLLSTDISVGTWDPTARTFTAGPSNANAVRVIGQRTHARGNAVPLIFAKIIGQPSCDVKTTSIASEDIMPYSMVALNSISLTGSSTIRRVASEAASGNVIVASNGTWTLGAGASIHGDVLYRTTAPSGDITGDQNAMSADIGYTAVSTPTGTMNMGPVSISSGVMPPIYGTFVCTTCQIGGTATFTLSGDVNLYCSGACTFSGNAQINTNGHKFTIYMTNNSPITFSNAMPLNVIIYGPASTMTVNATGKITGSFVCKTLSMTKGTIEYTSQLPIPIAPTGGGSAVSAGGVSTVCLIPAAP